MFSTWSEITSTADRSTLPNAVKGNGPSCTLCIAVFCVPQIGELVDTSPSSYHLFMKDLYADGSFVTPFVTSFPESQPPSLLLATYYTPLRDLNQIILTWVFPEWLMKSLNEPPAPPVRGLQYLGSLAKSIVTLIYLAKIVSPTRSDLEVP